MMMMIVPCQKQKRKKWQKAKAIKTNLVSTESSLYKLNYIHVCLFWVCGHVKICFIRVLVASQCVQFMFLSQ